MHKTIKTITRPIDWEIVVYLIYLNSIWIDITIVSKIININMVCTMYVVYELYYCIDWEITI